MGAGGSSATSRNGTTTTTKTVLMHKQEEENVKINRNVHLLSNEGNNKNKNGTAINSLARSAEDKDYMSKSKNDKHKSKMTLTPLSSEQRANSANDIVNLSTNSTSTYANSVNHHHNVNVHNINNNNSNNSSNSINVNHSSISANSSDRQSSRRQLILLHNRSISRTSINSKYVTRTRENKLHNSLVPEPHSKYALTTAEEEVERVLGGQLCGSAALEALQKINLRKQRVAESGAEEDWSALTRNADNVTLEILQHLHDADRCNSNSSNNNKKSNKSSKNNNKTSDTNNNNMEKWNHLHTCEQLLQRVRADQYEALAMMVYTKEGVYFHSQSKLNEAKECYSHAIRIAEQRVARQEKDMYMVLKRYVVAMIGLARIWYEHERDTKGFTFANQHRPYVDKQKTHQSKEKKEPTNSVDGEDKETSLSNSSMTSISSIASLESSLSSASGSVFSVNEALLKAVAPRPPRRRVGPMYTRVKLHVPRTLPASALLANRENEFVLHSKMTRELVASPCELLLLRCLEVVEIGHNSHSELLIPPLIELAQIYEDLSLFSRALLLVRRCVGILCSVYDYDHPWIVQLNLRTSRLTKELELQRRALMASKIQATWKMYRQMCAYEDMVHHPIRRHVHIARKYNIMHTNRVINNVNGTSNVPNGYGSVKNTTMTMMSSIVPSVMSTPFVLSSKGVDQATIIHNNNNNNLGSTGIIHNQAPDFLGTYMDGVPINSVINGEQTKHNNNSNKSSNNKLKTNRVLELSASELSNTQVTSETSSVLSQHEEVLLQQEEEEKYKEQEQEPIETQAESTSKEPVRDNTNNVKNAEHTQESDNAHGVHHDEGSDVDNRVFVPPVTYFPMEKSGEVNAVTTMVPNAKVIGTTQDTSTDTLLHQTTQGPVLTICTTTITRTVTEKVLSSDDDDEDEEDDEEDEDEDQEVVEVDDEDNV